MAAWQRASKLRKFGVIFAGAMLLFLLLVILVAVFAPATDETSQAASSPTAAPPPTPRPASTVVPATPADCPSAAEVAYLEPLGDSLTAVGAEGITALSGLLSEASAAPDPAAVLASPEWQLELGQTLLAINAHVELIESLNPPISGIVIQSEALEMTAVLRRMVEATGQFLATHDWTALDQIGDLGAEMNAISHRMMPMILGFCEG